MSVTDIKDMTPNQELINQLENLLVDAKAGRLRSMFSVCGWEDDDWTDGWALDERNTLLRMLGAISQASFQAQVNYALKVKNSPFSQAVRGE